MSASVYTTSINLLIVLYVSHPFRLLNVPPALPMSGGIISLNRLFLFFSPHTRYARVLPLNYVRYAHTFAHTLHFSVALKKQASAAGFLFYVKG